MRKIVGLFLCFFCLSFSTQNCSPCTADLKNPICFSLGNRNGTKVPVSAVSITYKINNGAETNGQLINNNGKGCLLPSSYPTKAVDYHVKLTWEGSTVEKDVSVSFDGCHPIQKDVEIVF